MLKQQLKWAQIPLALFLFIYYKAKKKLKFF